MTPRFRRSVVYVVGGWLLVVALPAMLGAPSSFVLACAVLFGLTGVMSLMLRYVAERRRRRR